MTSRSIIYSSNGSSTKNEIASLRFATGCFAIVGLTFGSLLAMTNPTT
jgi:hypothetical protein